MIFVLAERTHQSDSSRITQLSKSFDRRLLDKEVFIMLRDGDELRDGGFDVVLSQQPTYAYSGRWQGMFQCSRQLLFI
jgi:hypothetical protein